MKVPAKKRGNLTQDKGLISTAYDLPEGQQNEGTNDSESDHKKPRNPLNIFRTGIISLLTIGLLLLIVILISPTPTVPTNTPEIANPTVENSKITEQVIKHTPKLQKTIELWIPEITITNHPLSHYLLAPILLLFGSGLCFFWLLHQAKLRSRIRPLKPPVISAKC